MNSIWMDGRERLFCSMCLRAWRLAYGLTQDEVARRVGYTQPTISNYERGRGPWNRRFWARLFRGLEVRLS